MPTTTPVLLTLHIPAGAKGIPIACSADPEALAVFKRCVLTEYEAKVACASDEIIALTYRSELDRLNKLLDLLIPTGGIG